MPVISVAGTRVLLAMSPPGVWWRRHEDTGRDPDVTPTRVQPGKPRATRRTSPRRRGGWPTGREARPTEPRGCPSCRRVARQSSTITTSYWSAVGGKPVSNFAFTTASWLWNRIAVDGTWKRASVMTCVDRPGRQARR